MMTRILHTYTDVRPQDQLETHKQMARIAVLYPVISEKCVEPDDYWSMLLRNWHRQDNLIIVEQDVIPTHDTVSRLDNCVHSVCAYPYRLAAGQLSIFDIDDTDMFGPFHEYIPQFYETSHPEFVDGTSLGFTKISLSAQKKIPLHTYNVAKYEWWYLDSFISWYLKKAKVRVHVHYPPAIHNRTVEVNFGGLELSEKVVN